MANYLGTSGWYYQHWRGVFYPADLKQSKWFDFYCSKFKTVELNSTFYHFPTEKTAQTWYKKSPEGFIYTLKVNRFITHVKKFKGCKKQIRDFYRIGALLKEKRGCFLFQLPPSLKYSKGKLKEIISCLDGVYKNVVEFRHQSWFKEEVYDLLKEEGIIYCVVSAPGLPEDFKRTAKDVYVRFHGKESWYGSNYSTKELEMYAKKIKKLRAKNNWIYFNNDYKAYAVKNCLMMKKLF